MNNAQARKPKKWPLWVGPLAGYACVLAGSLGLVYVWRVVFYLGEVPLAPFFLGVAAVATVVYLAFLLASRAGKNNVSLRAALCVFVVGLLFVFGTGPLQVPDEGNHYLRAYAISQGRFNYAEDSEFPEDVNWLFEVLVSDLEGNGSLSFTHAVQYQGKELMAHTLGRYREGVASGTATSSAAHEPILFMLLPFLPAGLFMAVARLLGFGALGLLYAGRIANLLVYALLCYKIYQNCDKFRGVFIAVTLLPLSLSLAASCSYDSLMLALCFLAVSYFCKAEIHTRDIVVFGLALALATEIKLMNFVLAAVLLLIPKARWKSRLNPWACFGVILGGCLLAYWALGKFNMGVLAAGWPQSELDVARTEGAYPAGQIAFVFGNLPGFAARMLLTVYEQSAFLFELGVFGWMDLNLPLVSGLSVLLLAAAAALGIQQREDTRPGGAAGLLLAAMLYAGAILAGMYVLESPVGALRVSGLQPRYFLPAFLLVFMLASILLGKAVRPRLEAGGPLQARTESVTLWLAVGLGLLTAVLLFQSYYIGQWIPKAEGGHKLVNLLGWQIL